MLILNKIYSNVDLSEINLIIPLTAEQRIKTRQQITLDNNQIVYLQLARGTILKENDLLQSNDDQTIAQIKAKPEEIITVTAKNSLDLMKAAYHLGNRHIPLEINSNYLRFNADTVLEKMLIQLGLQIEKEIIPFYPELGAYHHH